MRPGTRTDFDLSLYFAVDSGVPCRFPLVELTEQAIAGGATIVQLRAKTLTALEFFHLGRELLQVTRRHRVPLIINDRLDIMLALDADGVHLGRSDLPLEQARRLAPGKIIGYSANAPEHLIQAVNGGADYIGIGPVFATATKRDTAPTVGIEGIRRLAAQAELPCVAIGGISAQTAEAVTAAGPAGVAVISALMSSANPREMAQRIYAAVMRAKGSMHARGGTATA